ncbi:MAG: hypothetical protein NTY53_24570, partial [Kiritimatiellaeota bacterium]|nr:hypothetical protein [Kiritimatiellota bacterium]
MKKMLMTVAMLACVPGWGATLEDCFRETFATNLTWTGVWSREAGQVKIAPDTSVRHQAAAALRVEFTGTHDWALKPDPRFPVKAGALIEASAWVRVRGKGSVVVCFALQDARNKVLAWSAGENMLAGDND